MRQKRIDSEQRAEPAVSKPAAAIETVRPFTGKQGQYLAFIYYYSKIHGTPPAEADPVAQLTKFKQMLDAGLITQADYDAAKAKVLGL